MVSAVVAQNGGLASSDGEAHSLTSPHSPAGRGDISLKSFMRVYLPRSVDLGWSLMQQTRVPVLRLPGVASNTPLSLAARRCRFAMHIAHETSVEAAYLGDTDMEKGKSTSCEGSQASLFWALGAGREHMRLPSTLMQQEAPSRRMQSRRKVDCMMNLSLQEAPLVHPSHLICC